MKQQVNNNTVQAIHIQWQTTLPIIQLEVAEKSAKQLKETLEELEGSAGEQNYQQYLDKVETTLKDKEKEVSKIKAAEKARVSGAMTAIIMNLTSTTGLALIVHGNLTKHHALQSMNI